MNIMDIKKIEETLEEKLGYCPDVRMNGKRLVVSIEWGDWKHDHMYCDYIMKEDFNCHLVWEDVTEDDGSDTYSADRYYAVA